MKQFNLKQLALMLLGILFLSIAATSCSKTGSAPGVPGIKDYGTHSIDPQLQGDWMWTEGSDIGYYNSDGTWSGGGYGFANRLSINSKGNGTLYSHIFSDLGPGSYLGVDIYYTGYYELDDNGTLTFYPMEGRYTNTDGTNRPLRSDELYNPSTGEGRTLYYPNISLTENGGREAFSTTSSGVTDYFYKQ